MDPGTRSSRSSGRNRLRWYAEPGWHGRCLGAGPSGLPADPDELAGIYRSQLSGRRVLVVLDNAASSEHVRPLLPGTAGCLAMVTSRNRLSGLVAVDGGQRLTLDVLPPGQADVLIARMAGSSGLPPVPAPAVARSEQKSSVLGDASSAVTPQDTG